MNDAHDNAATDREMADRLADSTPLEMAVEELTTSEAVEMLGWLARNKPNAVRAAFRNSPRARVRTIYIRAGRPHS
jgi:hypothetical protein